MTILWVLWLLMTARVEPLPYNSLFGFVGAYHDAPVYWYFLNATQALCPPKPKEVDKAPSKSTLIALFGV